jgi:hypothetical protein
MNLLGATALITLAMALPIQAIGQTGELRGEVLDPTGALVPAAEVMLSQGSSDFVTHSDAGGQYIFLKVAPGSYSVSVTAVGFAPLSLSDVHIATSQVKVLNLSLRIAVQQQQLTVPGESEGVSINPDENASAMVLKGQGLDALSDDPDELQSELEALAGSAAGPNGGQLYIDGYTGGQLPPKSSIREIRINHNPFSAEYDRLGYGRIEILTKPGSSRFHGEVSPYGTSSVLSTSNPFVQGNPDYYLFGLQGNLAGPVSKNASFFVSGIYLDKQNQSIVNAVNPQNPSAGITAAVPNPISLFVINPRLDVQVGKSNTFQIRDYFDRSVHSGDGVGALNLPEQAYNVHNEENDLQVADTNIINSRFLNETRFRWRAIRQDQTADYSMPTLIVPGAFTAGGNNAQIVRDRQSLFELQNYSTLSAGNHTIRFGTQLRAYNDRNYSTSGSNGSYTFASLAEYEAKQPSQYTVTEVANPVVKLLLFDGALFFQDDWRWKPNLMLSCGIRYEGQNRIHDADDWAPRLEAAWAPSHAGTTPARTVVRVGYGWFYNRFTVPNAFSSFTGTPYLMETIHDNLINQKSFVINNPGFYNPDTATSPGSFSSGIFHTIDPHFHAALDMQAAAGVDQKINKTISANVTYLYTRGTHQYLSNNVNAPSFNPSTYTISGSAPDIYNYQFQSGGVYRQQQLIVTMNARMPHFVLTGTYTLNNAKSDTQGATYFASVAQNPGLDYGRAAFDIRHRLLLVNTYTTPYGIVFASLLDVQSGAPYNITLGSDSTENNQYNGRPTYGICGTANVIKTSYGCLDTDPVGKGEKIIPFGLGSGPANAVYGLRVSKVFGIGPRVIGEAAPTSFQSTMGGNTNGSVLSGGAPQLHLDSKAPRRYNLTLIGSASNLFNIVNLGAPNGVISSPLFGRSQTLAGSQFSSPTPGNRSFMLQLKFAF